MSRRALGRGLSALFPETDVHQQDLLEVQIDLLDASIKQPRSIFKEEPLDELAASIKSKGIIQPIVVRRRGDRFEIVAGERRFRAAKRAGLQKIPCIVKSIPDESVLEFSLIENIQRQELNPMEEAHAYRRLVEELGLTQEEIARRIGKDRSTVTNSLRLLKLPREVQSLLEQEQISMGHARALLAISSPDRQRSLADQIARRGMSVREAEQAVKRANAPAHSANPPLAKKQSANVLFAEQKLSRRLAAPVKINFGGTGGTIQIKFSTPDDLSRIFDLLIKRDH